MTLDNFSKIIDKIRKIGFFKLMECLNCTDAVINKIK